MGKSTASSCFKIIACGSDSVEHDELEASSESKSSSDKRGWSFRKKSAKHRVLSNSINLETSSGNKDWPESANADLRMQSNSTTIQEKASVIQWADEKPQFSTVEKPHALADEKPVVSADEKPLISSDEKPVLSLDEKPVLSLDEKPVVPGDDKPMVLALEEPMVLSDEKPVVSPDEKPVVSSDEKPMVSSDEKPVMSSNEDSVVSSDEKPVLSSDKKLIITSEEKKPIVLSDEKPVVSSDEKPVVSSDEEPVVSTDEKPVVSALVDAEVSESVTTKVDDGKRKSDVVPDERAVLVIQTAVRAFLARRAQMKHKNIIKLQAAVRGHLVRRHAVGTLRCVQAIVKMQALVRARHANRLPEGSRKLNGKEKSGTNSDVTYTSIAKLVSNRFARQLLESSPRTKHINVKCNPSQSDSAWKWLERWMSVSSPGNEPSPQSECSPEHPEKASIEESDEHLITYETNLRDGSFPAKTEVEFTSVSLVPLETQSKEEVTKHNGSRKASNPAFIAAQTKFEELSSATAKSTRTSSSLSNHKTDDESSVNTFGATETALSENSVPHSTIAQVGGSECGTELSISSTLDSPDRSEVEALKDNSGTGHDKSNDLSQEEVKKPDYGLASVQVEQESQSSHVTVSDKSNGCPHVENDSTNDFSQEEKKQENGSVNIQIEQESSPRSQVTVPESQGTPSSRVSVNPKKIKSGSNSNPKRRIITKKSPSKPNHDPATVSSENLPKSGKRRNSFGSVKAGQVEQQQEGRESSSSNSLVPSYMQATESARAKAIANISPRSSPDVHSKDEYNIKKRHSLPGSNGRQGSPRIQRSLSNAQPVAKGNGTQSPQERKWQR